MKEDFEIVDVSGDAEPEFVKTVVTTTTEIQVNEKGEIVHVKLLDFPNCQVECLASTIIVKPPKDDVHFWQMDRGIFVMVWRCIEHDLIQSTSRRYLLVTHLETEENGIGERVSQIEWMAKSLLQIQTLTLHATRNFDPEFVKSICGIENLIIIFPGERDKSINDLEVEKVGQTWRKLTEPVVVYPNVKKRVRFFKIMYGEDDTDVLSKPFVPGWVKRRK